MAYAYPSGGDAAASTTSLGGSQSSPQKHAHHHGGQFHPGASTASSRKGSDEKFDILRDFKLKIEEDDNYILFFQDRIKVEQDYISGLKRLYSRSKAIDTLHDDAFRREEKSTTRKAWDEVRDYTQREIQAREALTRALKVSVVKDLIRLKEEQGRIRSGLKDSMKYANEMYDEHAKNQLPKIKRFYWQKCHILEDHKRQENAIAMQAKLLADTPISPGSPPLREHPNAITASGPFSSLSPPTSIPALPPSVNPAQPNDTSITSSIILSPKESTEKKRTRAGSASGTGGDNKPKDVFNDLAAQSKKGFNAILQKFGGDKDRDRDDLPVISTLDLEGGSGLQRRGTGARGDPARGMGTMRGVKVKRDADEADKAYRHAVFHLESLRLRRDKLQTSAAKNLETFGDDLNKTLVRALQAYIDTMHGTAATNAQATEVPRQVVEAVNLDKDLSIFRTRLRAVDAQRTLPVPYQNFYVGECRSLIFGVSLTDYDFARGEGTDHGRPPTIVEKCLAAIDERGLDSEGIYRISGRHAGVQKMIQDVELDEEKFAFNDKDDVFSISNVLKQYLRELPEPVFQFPHAERVKYTENRETHIASNFSALRGRLRRLPPIHQTTFQAIVEHLSRVVAHVAQNKMDGKNLAVVFNTVLFGQDQVGADTNLLTMTMGKDTLLEDLVDHSDLLFGFDDTTNAPTLFPPGAAFSRSGVISYHPVDDGPQPGSSRTRIQIVNPGQESTAVVQPPSRRSIPDDTPAMTDGETAVDPASEPQSTLTPVFEATTTTMSTSTFTPDEELDLLFDPALIPPSVQASLPEHLHIRPLASTDLMRSHFGLLQTLTIAPPMAPSHYTSLFTHLKSCPDTYYILVVIDQKSDQMVAHGAIVIEHKYIHGGGMCGHIEDIVVSPHCRGGGVGKTLVVGLRDLAVKVGCYKAILDCKEDRISFYEKCGFHLRAREMSYYRSNNDVTPSNTPDFLATVPPPNVAQLSLAGAHLALPPTTSTSTSHNGGGSADHAQQPLPTDSEPGGSPKTFTSTSSDTGITYHFPINPINTTALPPSLPRRPDAIESEQVTIPEAQPEALEMTPEAPHTPVWAAEGLGSSERGVPSPKSLSPTMESRLEGVRSSTPLPPGAAPPNLGEEPERIVQSRG